MSMACNLFEASLAHTFHIHSVLTAFVRESARYE